MKFRDEFSKELYENAEKILTNLGVPSSIKYYEEYLIKYMPDTFTGKLASRIPLTVETSDKDILVRYRKGYANGTSIRAFDFEIKTIREGKNKEIYGLFLAKRFKEVHELFRQNIELVIGETEREIIENFGKRLTELLIL